MIAASVALTVTAAVLFIVGLLSDGTGIIWGSIVASAAALASLIAGVLRGRKATPATIGGVPVGEVPMEPAMREAIPVGSDRDDEELTVAAEPFTLVDSTSEDEEEAEQGEEAVDLPVPRKPRSATTRKTPARKPAARKTPARKPAAPKTPAKSTAKTTRKPAAKSTAKPAAKTTRKPAVKPAAKTARKPAAKTTRKPATRKPTAGE